MKKIFFLFYFGTFTITHSYAQNVTLTELINNAKCKDYSSFNDFIAQKGFCFDKADTENSIGSSYRFSSCNVVKDGPKGIDTKNQASIMFVRTGAVNVDIGTSSLNYYKTLLTELKKLGFNSIETYNSDENSVAVRYKSLKYPQIFIMLSTYKVSKENVGDWTFWNFGVQRVK